MPAISSAQATANSTMASQDAPALIIAPGDLVQLTVLGTPELSGQLRVDDSGNLLLPAGGVVKVSGLSTTQAAAAIEVALKTNQIMLNPHVELLVPQYSGQSVTVLGQVVHPGSYLLPGRHSLYDALAAANGTTDLQGSTITVTHMSDPANPLVLTVHSPDYSAEQESTLISPGDKIFVSKASVVYVLGDVALSGGYPIDHGTTLSVLDGVTLAHGFNRSASTHAMIIRKSDGNTSLIPVNLKEVTKNHEPDLALRAGDILYVPTSEWKRFFQTFGPVAAAAVVNAASYASINHAY